MKNCQAQNKYKYFLAFGIILFFFFAFSHSAFAGYVYYWVGNSDNTGVTSAKGNWDTRTNQGCSGTGNATAAPATQDNLHFVSSCTSNVAIDSALSVNNIYIDPGYTGTITQNAGITVTMNSGFYQTSAATYTATTGTFDNNGTFLLSAGTFTPPTTANTYAGNFFTVSGTGNYNIGATATTTFDGGGGSNTVVTASGTLGGTVIINKSTGANVFTVATGTTISLGNNATTRLSTNNVGSFVNNGTVLVGTGVWTVVTGISSNYGTLTNNGSITNSGSNWVLTYTSFINNGTLTYGSGTIMTIDGNFTLGGTMTAASLTSLNIGANFTKNIALDLSAVTTTFNNIFSSTVTASGALGGTVIINKGAGYGITFTVATGTTISLGNNATSTLSTSGAGNLINSGTIIVGTGTWNVVGVSNNQGTLTNNGTITNSGSNWVLTANLTNNATITYSGSALVINGNFIQNSIFTAPSLTALSVGYNFTQSGTFDLTGKTITFNGQSNSTVTATAGVLGGTVVINKSGYNYSFTVATGTTINLGNNATTTLSSTGLGSLINNGTIIVGTGTRILINSLDAIH